MKSFVKLKNKEEQKKYNSQFKSLHCRMFENEYPKKYSLVYVKYNYLFYQGKVVEIKLGKVFVSLLEYDGIIGILPSKEISRYKTRFPRRIISKGKELVLKILAVNQKNGFIYLSKIKVTPEETIKYRENYKKHYLVAGIIILLSVRTKQPIKYLYENIVWPIYHLNNNPFNIFKNIALGKLKILKKLNIDKNIKNELIKIVKIRLPPKLLEIRSTFKLSCYTFDGIDAIKEALLNGKKLENNDISIIYQSLGAPLYECILYTYNINEGLFLMDESMNEVKNTITNKGGVYFLEKNPYIIYPKKSKFWF